MQYKILVVEDNLINQKLLDTILTLQGHVVIVAENGQQAIDIYNENVIDVIFMDYQMPVMDGKEATIKIREIEKQRKSKLRTPIYSVSGNLNTELIASLVDAGIDGFIPKPIAIRELKEVLKKKHIVQNRINWALV